MQTVPSRTAMFTWELVQSNAKRQAARAENINDAEICETDFEPNPL